MKKKKMKENDTYFVYLKHARESIRERKITESVIEDAIFNPDETIPSKKGRKIAHKIIGNRLLRIIYKKHKKAYIVLTAYYTKPERYTK